MVGLEEEAVEMSDIDDADEWRTAFTRLRAQVVL